MIVLDTHVLVWWVNGDADLSRRARAALRKEQAHDGGEIIVSTITAWEIAMLVGRKRLVLSMDVDNWLDEVQRIPQLRFEPVSTRVAVQSVRLPGQFHKDPADRMIVALARQLNAPLVSADGKIRGYSHVRTLW